MRLARTYRIAAWAGLLIGPLIGVMALSSSFGAAGRLMWILLVVAATALMFVTWHATSELIVAMLEMAESLHRAENRIAALEKKLAEWSDGDAGAVRRKPTKRRKPRSQRASRSRAHAGARAADPNSPIAESAERVSARGDIDRAV